MSDLIPYDPTDEELQEYERQALEILPVEVSVSALAGFDTGEDVPMTAICVFALSAVGLNRREIASALKFKSAEAVDYYFREYDPHRRFRLSQEQIRQLVLATVRAKKQLALLKITPDKLERMTAVQLSAIALNLQKVEHWQAHIEDPMEQKSEGTQLIENLQADIDHAKTVVALPPGKKEGYSGPQHLRPVKPGKQAKP